MISVELCRDDCSVFCVEVGKGMLRTMIGNITLVADIVPVDVVSNLMIVSAWYRTVAK